MPQIENKWTVGNVAQLIGLLTTIIAVGIAIGSFNERLEHLEDTARQSVSDSRTLIELRTDVAYIKQAVQNLTRDLQSASLTLPCPTDQPVLVAAHCRANPSVAFNE